MSVRSNPQAPRRSPSPRGLDSVSHRFFASGAKGTEGLLRAELRELGIRSLRGDRGGVHFGGELEAAFRVCLGSRIAVRVLEVCCEVSASTEDQLYEAARGLRLDGVLEPQRTFAVTANISSCALRHSQYVARRIKDAIVDVQRERFGRRSDVDPSSPDVHVVVRWVRDRLTFYLDLSGVPLHRRGYRDRGAEAPLKENLAAALVRWAEYDGSLPFVDPCCGSGTIAIEAAMVAYRRAPGLGRRRYALEGFPRTTEQERQQYRELRAKAESVLRQSAPQSVTGYDLDLQALDAAQRGAGCLGLDVKWGRRDVLQLSAPSEKSVVVLNPPYGVRMQGGEDFTRRLGAHLRGWREHRLVVLTPNRSIEAGMGVRASAEHTFFNGDLEVRAFRWDPP